MRKDSALNQIHWSTNRRVAWHSLAILAFDHRAVFDDLALRFRRSAKDIARFKELVYKAVLNVQQGGPHFEVGIIADDAYGLDILLDSNKYPLWVGRSIEKSGSSSLEFEGLPDVCATLASWPENHVVKCLFRVEENMETTIADEQKKQLARLFCATRETGHDLLLEPVTDGQSRDTLLLEWIDGCYAMGIYPDYWQLQAPVEPAFWENIAAVIQKNDPYCRGILLLGNSSPAEELEHQFNSIPAGVRMLGFATGGSVFMEPATRWFAGEFQDSDVIDAVAGTFARLCAAWKRR